jgi:hypothetical protein
MILHNKFIFVHLTKAGGTFVRQYLSNYISDCVREVGGRRLEKHDGLCVLPELILNSRFKFGVVRNPLSFYISLWAANVTPKAIKNRPRRTSWFKQKPEMKKNPREFIRFICDNERGVINHFNFDLIRKLDIGVLTYRYLHLFYNHEIFKDVNWEKNHKKYRLVDEVLLLENSLSQSIERLFRRKIFRLDKRQRNGLLSYSKKNESIHGPFMEYYDQETIEYVKYKDRFVFKLHYPEGKR